jgi:hypothetical protein
MFSALTQPWILARLVTGTVAALLATVAAVGALRIFARYRADAPPDERTLALERQSELVGTTLSLAFTVEIAAALLTVLASDRLSGAIRGAMCAYGVFGSNPWGTPALAGSLAAAAGCAAWLATRRVDARLRRGSLVRTLAGLALLVTGLVYADLALSARYFLGLDLDVVATCCSVFVDAPAAGYGAMADARARTVELLAGGVGGLAALGAGVELAQRASPMRGALAGALGLAGSYAALRAVTDVIAPYAYESPHHRCPYCLLHLEAGLAGPVLLGALVAATLAAVAVLAVVPLARREGARAAATEVLARLGRVGSVVWALVLAAGAYPVLRYGLVTGTFRLFR